MKTGTKEWSEHSVNCCTGCRHDCVYCYAAEMAARFGRRRREDWAREEVRIKDVNKYRRYVGGRIMFPSSHDITDGNLDACLCVLQRLLHAGNDVVLVTKGRPSIVQQISDRLTWDDRKRLLWRFTIGGLNEPTWEFWEPHAPPFDQRIQALRLARQAHWQTSVSCEPLLEPWNAAELVASVAPYVTGEIWIGALNDMKRRCGWRYPMTEPRIVQLAHWQTPAVMARVYNALTAAVGTTWPLDDATVAKLRWKDSYQKALGINAAGNASTSAASGPQDDDQDPGRVGGRGA